MKKYCVIHGFYIADGCQLCELRKEKEQPKEPVFTLQTVIEMIAQYGDHYATGMAQDKWTDPNFKGNIEIVKEFMKDKFNIEIDPDGQ